MDNIINNDIIFPLNDHEVANLLGIAIGSIRGRKSELKKKGILKEGEHYKEIPNPNSKSSTDFNIFLWEISGVIEVALRARSEKARNFLKAQGIDNVKGTRIEHNCIDIIEAALNGIGRCRRQYRVDISKINISYKIDLYLPEYKMAIECDETIHGRNFNISTDIYRQQLIEKYLGCQFIRFNPEERNFNIGNVLNKIFLIIIEQKTMSDL